MHNLIYYNNKHKKFYYKCLAKNQYQDYYCKLVFDIIEMNNDYHYRSYQFYNFSKYFIKVKEINEGWHIMELFQASLLISKLNNYFFYKINQIISTPYIIRKGVWCFFIELIQSRYSEYVKSRQLQIREIQEWSKI